MSALATAEALAGQRGKVWVVVNPVAGGHRALEAWAGLKPILESRVPDAEVFHTTGPGHATDIGHAAVSAGVDRLLIVGGDGTIQEVAAGVLGSGVVLGTIPAGTGNDFSRTHLIPRDLHSAFEVALSGEPAAIDLGRVNGRPFINVGGVGFDAEVAAWTKHRTRRFGGPVLYLAGVLTQLWSYEPQVLSYSIDDGPVRTEHCLLISVGNGRYYGGGMMICPKADARDGILDVVVGGRLGKLETLRLLPKVFSGKHLGQPKVTEYWGRKIVVSGPAHLTVHADGEPVTKLPATFEVLPGALLVAMPAPIN